MIAVTRLAYPISPEQVLGEYWNDPLFGSAAAHHSVTFEILHRRIWPRNYELPAGRNVQIVIENRTNEKHLIAFDMDIGARLKQPEFIEFIEETLAHADEKVSSGRYHSHGNTNVDEAAAIVKTLDQQPTVFVKSHDTKEILLNFEQPGHVYLFCALDAHHKEGWKSELTIQQTDKLDSTGVSRE